MPGDCHEEVTSWSKACQEIATRKSRADQELVKSMSGDCHEEVTSWSAGVAEITTPPLFYPQLNTAEGIISVKRTKLKHVESVVGKAIKLAIKLAVRVPSMLAQFQLLCKQDKTLEDVFQISASAAVASEQGRISVPGCRAEPSWI